MLKKLCLITFVAMLLPGAIYAQDAKTTLEKAAQAIGAANLKSLQYSGSGANFAVGQSHTPGEAWPKFNIKSYDRIINYETASSREEIVRTQGENPPRGGGGQPMAGEQRQVALVSGKFAWNLMGNNANPAPGNLIERQLSILTTPHGFLKAALASNATAKARTIGGKMRMISCLTIAFRKSVAGRVIAAAPRSNCLRRRLRRKGNQAINQNLRNSNNHGQIVAESLGCDSSFYLQQKPL